MGPGGYVRRYCVKNTVYSRMNYLRWKRKPTIFSQTATRQFLILLTSLEEFSWLPEISVSRNLSFSGCLLLACHLAKLVHALSSCAKKRGPELVSKIKGSTR